MTIFSDKEGFGLRLTKEEEKRFLRGEEIYKLSGDNRGYLAITLKMKQIEDPYIP